jgi:hypothetical protein
VELKGLFTKNEDFEKLKNKEEIQNDGNLLNLVKKTKYKRKTSTSN